MRYQVIFCMLFFSFFNFGTEGHKFLIQNCVQKTEQLQVIKKKLQTDALQHHEQLFDDLQSYGRCAGQVATSVILLTDKKNNKLNTSYQPALSGCDKANIVQVIVVAFVLMVEFARFCHARKMHKKMIHAMTYNDFVAYFPQLVLVEYQILLMKTLIALSMHGTFPEQVFSKIALTKMSLPYPYAKFANKAAKKMYKKTFNAQGHFMLVDISACKHPYKKFAKKVAQGWQEIALKANSFPEKIEAHYDSSVASLIDTPLNNGLITMIHAGMKSDFVTLEKIRQKFAGNQVVEKLFDYYAG